MPFNCHVGVETQVGMYSSVLTYSRHLVTYFTTFAVMAVQGAAHDLGPESVLGASTLSSLTPRRGCFYTKAHTCSGTYGWLNFHDEVSGNSLTFYSCRISTRRFAA